MVDKKAWCQRIIGKECHQLFHLSSLSRKDLRWASVEIWRKSGWFNSLCLCFSFLLERQKLENLVQRAIVPKYLIPSQWQTPHPPYSPIFFFKKWSVMVYGDVLKLFLKPRCMLQSIVRFDMFILLHLFKPDTVCWVGTLEREQSCSTSASWRTISWTLAACAVGMYGWRDW